MMPMINNWARLDTATSGAGQRGRACERDGQYATRVLGRGGCRRLEGAAVPAAEEPGPTRTGKGAGRCPPVDGPGAADLMIARCLDRNLPALVWPAEFACGQTKRCYPPVLDHPRRRRSLRRVCRRSGRVHRRFVGASERRIDRPTEYGGPRIPPHRTGPRCTADRRRPLTSTVDAEGSPHSVRALHALRVGRDGENFHMGRPSGTFVVHRADDRSARRHLCHGQGGCGEKGPGSRPAAPVRSAELIEQGDGVLRSR